MMNTWTFKYIVFALSLILIGCSAKLVRLTEDNLNVINRELAAVDPNENTIELNAERSDGLAIVEDIAFTGGIIEIDLKGEDVQGKSFVGVAFNVENDSTYEAVYFRPFNFRSEEAIRRAHSVQYIHHPEKTWRYLRTNYEGRYEAEFPRRPDPDDWFAVRIVIDAETVTVYDAETSTELLSVERLTEPVSDRVALWTGFNSRGAFRDLRVTKRGD